MSDSGSDETQNQTKEKPTIVRLRIEDIDSDRNNNSNNQDEQDEIAIKIQQFEELAAKKHTKKRLYKGCKASQAFKYEITPLKQKENAFALQEYIREVIRNDPTNVEACIAIPEDIQASTICYQLEVMKYFLIEVGFYVVYISSQCNRRSCAKMQATTKFMYRCAAHKRPKDCSAIQYCIHTLDLFTEKLTGKEYQVSFKISTKRAKKDMSDLCRRVYRIFAHAYYHHRPMFNEYEAETLLCTRFVAFFKKYQLVSRELFSREIQIPANSLYFNSSNRKQKIEHYIHEKNRKMLAANQRPPLKKLSSDDFMRNVEIPELDSNEVY